MMHDVRQNMRDFFPSLFVIVVVIYYCIFPGHVVSFSLLVKSCLARSVVMSTTVTYCCLVQAVVVSI